MRDACYPVKGTKIPPAAQTGTSSPACALCSLMKASTVSMSLGITRTISYASKGHWGNDAKGEENQRLERRRAGPGDVAEDGDEAEPQGRQRKH